MSPNSSLGKSSALGGASSVSAAPLVVGSEAVVSSTGLNVRLSRPLDFLVVTDHSDGMGAVDELFKGNPERYLTEIQFFVEEA